MGVSLRDLQQLSQTLSADTSTQRSGVSLDDLKQVQQTIAPDPIDRFLAPKPVPDVPDTTPAGYHPIDRFLHDIHASNEQFPTEGMNFVKGVARGIYDNARDLSEQVFPAATDLHNAQAWAQTAENVFGLSGGLPPQAVLEHPLPFLNTAALFAAGPTEGLAKEALAETVAPRLVGLAARFGIGAGLGYADTHSLTAALGAGLVGSALGGEGARPTGALSPADLSVTSAPGMMGNVARSASDILEQAKAGGFTYDPRTGKFNPAEGFLVGQGRKPGVFSTVGVENPNAAHLVDLVDQNSNLFTSDPTVMMGGWVDDAGKLYLEPTKLYQSASAAFLDAVQNGEQAMGQAVRGEDGTVSYARSIDTSSPDAKAIAALMESKGMSLDQAALTHFADDPAKATEYFSTPPKPSDAQPIAPNTNTIADVDKAANEQAGTALVASGAGGAVPPAEPPATTNGAAEPPGGEGGGAGGGAPVDPEHGPNGNPEDDWIWSLFTKGQIESPQPLTQLLVEQLKHAAKVGNLAPKLVRTWDQVIAEGRETLNKFTTDQLIEQGQMQMATARAMSDETLMGTVMSMRRIHLEVSGLLERYTSPFVKDRDEIMQRINDRQSQFNKLAANLSKSRSQFGRNLNMLKIVANSTTDPTYWLYQAQKLAGGPLSDDEKLWITKQLYDANHSTSFLEKNRIMGRLSAGVANLQPLAASRKIASIWRANLLLTPKSLAKAAVGHTLYAGVMDAVAKNIGDFLDGPVAAVKGLPRQRYFAPIADMQARWSAIKAALKTAGEYYKTGVGTNALNVTETPPEHEWDRMGDQQSALWLDRMANKLTSKGNTMLGAYVRYVTRAYGVIPHIVRAQALAASIDSQLRAIVHNENLGGALGEQRLKELYDQLPATVALKGMEHAEIAASTVIPGRKLSYETAATIAKRATVAADRAALTHVGGVARVAFSLKEGLDKLGALGHLAGTGAMPFVLVPSNIVQSGFEYSPFAGAVGIGKLVKLARGRFPADELGNAQWETVDHLSKATVGGALLALGYFLRMNHQMTPTRSTENAVNQTATVLNQPAESFRIANSKLMEAAGLAPLTAILEVGGAIYDWQNDPMKQGLLKGMGATASAYGQALADAPFMEGMREVQNAVEQPGSAAYNYMKEVSKGLVPTGVAQVAQAMDPDVRDTGDQNVMGLVHTLESRIPGLSRKLPLARNALGLPITRPGGIQATNPFPVVTDLAATDPVYRMLQDSHIAIEKPSKMPGETQVQYNARLAALGKVAYPLLRRLQATGAMERLAQRAQQMSQESGLFHNVPPDVLTQILQQTVIRQVLSAAHRSAAATSPLVRLPPSFRDAISASQGNQSGLDSLLGIQP